MPERPTLTSCPPPGRGDAVPRGDTEAVAVRRPGAQGLAPDTTRAPRHATPDDWRIGLAAGRSDSRPVRPSPAGRSVSSAGPSDSPIRTSDSRGPATDTRTRAAASGLPPRRRRRPGAAAAARSGAERGATPDRSPAGRGAPPAHPHVDAAAPAAHTEAAPRARRGHPEGTPRGGTCTPDEPVRVASAERGNREEWTGAGNNAAGCERRHGLAGHQPIPSQKGAEFTQHVGQLCVGTPIFLRLTG